MNRKFEKNSSLWRGIVPSGSNAGPLAAVVANILLVYVAYSLTRLEFLAENRSFFEQAFADGRVWNLLRVGFVFDTPGIFYTNALYILLMLLPFHLKERTGWYRMCKWEYIVVNAIGLVANLADSVYFRYTLRRTDFSIFGEFANETNAGKIAGVEMLRHWYLLILLAVLVWGMWKLYSNPAPAGKNGSRMRYYIAMLLSLAFSGAVTVGAIRGGWLNHWYCYIIAAPLLYAAWRLLHLPKSRTSGRNLGIVCAGAAVALIAVAPVGGWRHRDIRPITISNANAYTEHPIETALVLNTPFTLIRTIGNVPFSDPGYFRDKARLEAIFTPVRTPVPGDSVKAPGKNLVILIVESFAKEYIGSMNADILGPDYKGYTPFIDSLVRHSAWWRHSYDNGRKSIDGIPSILTSIPMFVRPFVVTPQAVNTMKGIPALLGEKGYSTAFFHGARTGSMGFNGIAASIGFDKYYGREDFRDDTRTGGDAEFDGYWAIWDEPFLEWYALMMTDMPQPFMTAVFTASNHHPFHIPAKYEGKFPEGDLLIHKTCGYTDYAIRQFFEVAKTQPWYDNTIFVITNDHTNMIGHDEYRSDIGTFYGPVIIFDPSGEITPGEREGIVQQIDILPTMVNYLGYDRPYVAFGCDVFNTPVEEQWAVNYINGTYQYVKNGLVLQFDGNKTTAVYSIDDHLMSRNLIGTTQFEAEMETELKAIIQQYMDRMLDDRLTIAN